MTDIKNNEVAAGVGVAAEKALDFIEKVIAGPVIEVTGAFTDKVKYWRFKNQVDIIQKARAYLQEKGIETPKKIPIKDVTTLLEHASFAEEEEMQDSCAYLLSNALNPDNEFNACHLFSQILNQLSINEIYILKYIYSCCFMMSSDDRPYIRRGELSKYSETDYQTAMLLLDNLLRLRLIEEQPPQVVKTANYSRKNKIKDIVFTDCFRLSKFGSEFLKQILN